jgi:hypothetical protein
MHVMIRRYSMSGSMDALMRTVDRQFAAQLSADGSPDGTAVRLPEGIVGYQAVRTGENTLLTITAFASAALLERAQQAAADIRRSLAEFHVEEIETFSGKVDINRADAALTTPHHPDDATA